METAAVTSRETAAAASRETAAAAAEPSGQRRRRRRRSPPVGRRRRGRVLRSGDGGSGVLRSEKPAAADASSWENAPATEALSSFLEKAMGKCAAVSLIGLVLAGYVGFPWARLDCPFEPVRDERDMLVG